MGKLSLFWFAMVLLVVFQVLLLRSGRAGAALDHLLTWVRVLQDVVDGAELQVLVDHVPLHVAEALVRLGAAWRLARVILDAPLLVGLLLQIFDLVAFYLVAF